MTYKIKIIVKGGNELKNDLEKGHIELGMSTDVFPDEEIVQFQFSEMPEEKQLKDLPSIEHFRGILKS